MALRCESLFLASQLKTRGSWSTWANLNFLSILCGPRRCRVVDFCINIKASCMTLITNLRGFRLPLLHLGKECSHVFMLMRGLQSNSEESCRGVLLINKAPSPTWRGKMCWKSVHVSKMAAWFQVVSLTNRHKMHRREEGYISWESFASTGCMSTLSAHTQRNFCVFCVWISLFSCCWTHKKNKLPEVCR